MKFYRNFEEIDRDLQIKKLQNQIDREQIKLDFNNVKESLSPVSFIANITGAIAERAFVVKAVNTILGITRVKKVKKSKDADARIEEKD
ncbi:MAG: hypothetical protein CL868_06755 [Cytophagaceae bacterium]|nr:hypothetical protein [Cytophagaceae bacterium]|tara:strand:- start:29390 stop:29656 length:267 start_codon:yes stop_codon:yes gene_type:complete